MLIVAVLAAALSGASAPKAVLAPADADGRRVTAPVALAALVARVPAFARQTGLPCSGCHTQHFPTLNAAGRQFKLDGFTLMGAQPKVEGSRLSLPMNLNASLFLKIRAQKTNGTDDAGEHTTNSWELQFPDEFAMLVGGHVSQHVGFVLEAQLAEGGAVMAGFKMPFTHKMGDVQGSVIPFTTDGLGVAYGFELLNTGAVRNMRMMEHRKDFSAQQYAGTSSAASGVAFVAGNQHFFANFSRWAPVHLAAPEGLAAPLPTANYFRIAMTPAAGAWDLGFGAQSWFGSATVDDGSGKGMVKTVDTKAWALDGQAQGRVGSMPLGVFLSVARSAGTAAGANANLFNGRARDLTAFALSGELGVLPERGSVLLAYRAGDNGKASHHQDQALTFGGIYQLQQNVQFQLNWTFRSGDAFTSRPSEGNQLLTLMLAAGF